jgi:hypothetical protein
MRWQEKHLHLFEEAQRAKLDGQGKPFTGAELDKILQNYTVGIHYWGFVKFFR